MTNGVTQCVNTQKDRLVINSFIYYFAMFCSVLLICEAAVKICQFHSRSESSPGSDDLIVSDWSPVFPVFPVPGLCDLALTEHCIFITLELSECVL